MKFDVGGGIEPTSGNYSVEAEGLFSFNSNGHSRTGDGGGFINYSSRGHPPGDELPRLKWKDVTWRPSGVRVILHLMAGGLVVVRVGKPDFNFLSTPRRGTVLVFGAGTV